MWRPAPHRARPIAGTLLLSGIGAVVGGSIGTVALLPMLAGRPLHLSLVLALTWGGSFGALVGAIVAPVAGWTLLRHVPLGWAIAGTAGGTLAGALLVFRQPIIGGVAGYIAAAAVLGYRYRLARREHLQ